MPSRADAAGWRRWARDWWRDAVRPALENELEAACPAGETLRLGRVEVELPVPAREPGFVPTRELITGLRSRLQQVSLAPDSAPGPHARSPSPAESPARDALTAWLATGLVPWWANRPSAAELAAALRERLQDGSGPGWLRGLLLRHPSAARRLALQFDAAWNLAALESVRRAGGVVARVGPDEASQRHRGEVDRTVDSIASQWTEWARPPAGSSAREPSPGDPPGAAPAAAGSAVTGPTQPASPHAAHLPALAPPDVVALRQACRLWLSRQTHVPDELARLAKEAELADTRAAWEQLHSRLPPEGPEAGASRRAAPGPGEATLPPNADALPGASALPPNQAPSHPGAGTVPPHAGAGLTPTSPSVQLRDDLSEALREALAPGLPVSNAGLVLLAPYLPRFFAAVGVDPLTDGLAGAPPSQAPLLLHLLATGSADAAEGDLVIPKLLCGLPPDLPVHCHAGFPETTFAEAGRLLDAVIRHWGALKQTSAAGLQESFLRRRGLLRPGEAAWQLQVESRAWDVLLGRVPWTFRTVRLPWMPRPLLTEWEVHA